MIVGALLLIVMAIKIRTHTLSEYAQKLEGQFEEKTYQLIENAGQLEKLSKDLEKSNLALGEKMEQQGEYFNALMHDFKTPLTSIVASSDLLPQITQKNKLKVLSDQIQKNALFLKKRIDQHFDIAKGNMNILEARKELISFYDLVKSVIASTSSNIYSKHISLKLNIDSDLPTVYVDEQKLVRVLHNLLDNAYKWTQEGGAIIINVNRNDSFIRVEVHDNGCGMSKETLKNIFKPYYHSNKNEQYHSDSIGLGLAICKTYVNLHGGDIWVKSELGKGTTVVFSIPVNS
jgi:signal transduction histidine kinase